MTSFQLVAFAMRGTAVALTLALAVRRRITPRITLAWGALWIGAGVAIAEPEITAVMARALGIARGADLVFYLAILGMFVGFFVTYLRLRRVDAELTRIVRELALRNAKEPERREPE
jgi:hypothetical protein